MNRQDFRPSAHGSKNISARDKKLISQIREEKMASKGYHQDAQHDKAHAKTYNQMSKDELRHSKNLERIRRDNKNKKVNN